MEVGDDCFKGGENKVRRVEKNVFKSSEMGDEVKNVSCGGEEGGK